jgi:tRNA(Ile)-lysidine synthase
LKPGSPTVWDGRFELVVDSPGMRVRRLAGLARRLPAEQQRAVRELPAAARSGLPALVAPDDSIVCPILTGAAVDLVADRLRAAAGLIAREPA